MRQPTGRTKRPGRRRVKGPHPIDVHVGARVRLRRKMLGLTQEKLSAAIGLTFQQVQKYERGANRLGASRLQELAEVLDVPVAFFFDDTDPVHPPAMLRGLSQNEAAEADPLRRGETGELVTSYYAIAEPIIRRRFFQLAKALAVETDKPS